jgi:hypothetical protein
MLLAPGTYNITCSSQGYQSVTAYNVVVLANQVKSLPFYLTPLTDDTKMIGNEMPTAFENEINIFPNPAKEYVNITGKDITEILITNQSGMKVFEDKNAENINKINLDGLKPGIYFARIVSQSGVTTQKIVVE